MQQQSIGRFIVSSEVLMSHIEELCEITIGISLQKTREAKINKSAFTSSVTTIEIDENQNFTLIINCDDSLIDAVFEFNSVDVIRELPNTIVRGIANVFQNDPRFGFPLPPAAASDGVIAQTLLKHSGGCIEILLTEFDKFPFSAIDF